MRMLVFSHITVLGLIFGCGNHTKSTIPFDSTVPEDFSNFYELFHTDSIFQMDHILFPLDGRPAADTSRMASEDFRWEKADWKIHSFEHFDQALYDIHRKVTDSTLITEFILDKKSGFGIKRRFAKFGNKWFLIYYDAMNPGQ